MSEAPETAESSKQGKRYAGPGAKARAGVLRRWLEKWHQKGHHRFRDEKWRREERGEG